MKRKLAVLLALSLSIASVPYAGGYAAETEQTAVVETAEVQVLTNGRSFADEKYTMQFEPFSQNRLYFEIPIHAEEGNLHDRIAGIQGAFDQTCRGIKLLQKYKMPVGIRVVVQKLNIQHLVAIVDMIANRYPNIMYIDFLGLEVMGNAFKNKADVWIEFDEVKHFLENAVEYCLYRGIEPRLFRRFNLRTNLAKKNPIIIGSNVMIIP